MSHAYLRRVGSDYYRWIGPDCQVLVDGCLRLLEQPEAAIWPQLAKFQLSEDEPFAPCWLAMAGAIWPYMSSAPIDVDIFKSALVRLEAVAPQCPPAYRFALRHWPAEATKDFLASPSGRFYIDYSSYDFNSIKEDETDVVLNYLALNKAEELEEIILNKIDLIGRATPPLRPEILDFIIEKYNKFLGDKSILINIIRRDSLHIPLCSVRWFLWGRHGDQLQVEEFIKVSQPSRLTAFLVGYHGYKADLSPHNEDEVELLLFYIFGFLCAERSIIEERIKKAIEIAFKIEKIGYNEHAKILKFIIENEISYLNSIRSEIVLDILQDMYYLSVICSLNSIGSRIRILFNQGYDECSAYFFYKTAKKYGKLYDLNFETFLSGDRLLALLKSNAKSLVLINKRKIIEYENYIKKLGLKLNYWEILHHKYVYYGHAGEFSNTKSTPFLSFHKSAKYNILCGNYEFKQKEGIEAVIDMIKVIRDIMLVDDYKVYNRIEKWLKNYSIEIAFPVFMIAYKNKDYIKLKSNLYNDENMKYLSQIKEIINNNNSKTFYDYI